jgi:hypothetical protein
MIENNKLFYQEKIPSTKQVGGIYVRFLLQNLVIIEMSTFPILPCIGKHELPLIRML